MDVTRIVIDTDPGVDDAIALFLAVASPELDVVGVAPKARRQFAGGKRGLNDARGH